MKKDRCAYLSSESFKPGDHPYRVCVIIRQPQFDEVQRVHNFQYQHDKILLKDSQHDFDRIFVNKNANEEIYKCVFKELVGNFLSGTSHMIQIIGERHSGKGSLSIGNMRNPGLILLILQEIFNFIEEKFLENNVTIKLSVYEYDEHNGFRDLLVLDQQQFQPYFTNYETDHLKQPQQNQLLGIPEVIVDNYLLAMKILRIAMVNMINKEQNITSQKFYERHKKTNLIVEIKAEISPSDDLKEQVIISKLRIVKFDGEFKFGQVYKTMADLSTKKRKHVEVPFKSSELLDYFRDFLMYQSQTILMCVNYDNAESIKFGSTMREIRNRSQFISISIYQQNNQLKEIMSNQKESLNLFYKEFCTYNDNKRDRGRIIFPILLNLANVFKSILTYLDQASEIKYKLNCLYSQIISFHCSKYNNIINTEDVKEFYLAKIQLYAIEQVQLVSSQCQQVSAELLADLQHKIKNIYLAKKQLSKMSKTFLHNIYLSQYDIQRLSNTHILVSKLVSIFDLRLGYNILNQLEPKYYQIFDQIIETSELYKEDNFNSNYPKQENNIQQNIPLQKPPVPKFFKPMILNLKQSPSRQRFTDVIQQLFHDDNTKEYYSSQPLFSLTKVSEPQQLRQTVQSDLFEKLQFKQAEKHLNIKNVVLEAQRYKFFQTTGVAFLKNQYRYQGNKRTASQMLPRIHDNSLNQLQQQ